MENVEWRMGITTIAKLRPPPQITHGEPLATAVKAVTPGEIEKLYRKTFKRQNFSILHSSPVEEKNGIPQSSENGPFAIQEERATSPFSKD